jgi:hypothetical protein
MSATSPSVTNEWIESKKGWVYEKKRHLIFSKQLVPRWMVLYSKPVPALALYEQRSDARPPYAPYMHHNITEIDLSLVDANNSGLETNRPSRSPSVVSIPKAKIKDIITSSSGNNSKKDKAGTGGKGYIQITQKGTGQKIISLLVDSAKEALEWVNKFEEERLIYQQSLFKVESVIDDIKEKEAEKALQRIREKDLVLTGCRKVLVKGELMEKLLGGSESPTEIESLLGDMHITNDIVWNEAWNYNYLEALSLKRQSTKKDERLAYEIDMHKAKGEFNAFVVKKAIEIVDSYHKCNKVPSRSSFGPIQIEFIANYDCGIEDYSSIVSSNGGDKIKDAEVALKNEFLAQAYINHQNQVSVLSPLMTLVEYKGFQLLGYFTLPLDEFNLVSDNHLLENLAKDLFLGIPYNISASGTDREYLHPSVRLNKINSDNGEVFPGIFISNLNCILPKWIQNVPATDDFGKEQRIRPELLQRFKQQLACDDLCFEKTIHAVEFLQNKVIDEFVTELEALDELPTDSGSWTDALHSRGINCCLLGKILNLKPRNNRQKIQTSTY